MRVPREIFAIAGGPDGIKQHKLFECQREVQKTDGEDRGAEACLKKISLTTIQALRTTYPDLI
jgi:hypothetical protein